MLQHFLTAMFASLACAAALPAAENELPGVTVFGAATTQVTPDQMAWRLVVNNRGPKLSSVAEQHTKFVQQVLDFLKERGIKDSDLQSSQMEFGENWVFRAPARVKEGYFASTQISFRTSNLTTYKPLWLGLAEMSGITVEGVNYDHSKRIAFQNETRRKAVLAAKEKAADLAKALGSEIAEPLRIEEDLSVNEGWQATTNNWSNSNENQADRSIEQAEAEEQALAPGTIPIRIRVKVTFRLVTHGN